jgi:hypothetical protein
MSDTESGDGIGIEEGKGSDFGDTSSPEGNVVTRKVQEGERVNLPDNFLSHLDVGAGDNVLVACEENGITIKEASVDNIQE